MTRPPGISVEIRPTADGAVVFVKDRGPGIAPEDLPRPLDRFYQSKGAREKKTGLGLYITKGLVEAHAGGSRSTTSSGAARYAGMSIFNWHELHIDHGVLEVSERLTPRGLALELHVVMDPETGRSLAWWQTERAEWLGGVEAGEA